MAKTFASEWRLEFDAAPEVLWPLLADTERLNEAAKIPRVEMEEYVDDEGKLCRIGRARAAGITFEWVDEPYEWVTNRWFRHNVRVFNKGPVAELIPELELTPGPNGGSVATYRLAGAPRGALGELLFRTGYLQRMGRAYAKVAANAEAFLAGARETAFDAGKGELTSDARASTPSSPNLPTAPTIRAGWPDASATMS